MPNWCANKLIIEHEDPNKIKEVAAAYNKEELLSYFAPCPEELYLEGLTTYSSDHPEMYESLRKEMKVKYGYESWYEWCFKNWGTKWDISTNGSKIEADGNSLELSFDTAWSPPIAAMKTAEEQGFKLELLFYEPGMFFCGLYYEDKNIVVPPDTTIGKAFVENFD